MSKRKANKIIRSLFNGYKFNKSFSCEYSFGHNSYFKPDALFLVCYYSDSIKQCVFENDFVYFFTTKNHKKYFECSFNTFDNLSIFNEYQTVDEKFKFVNRFLNNDEERNLFASIYKHYLLQSGAEIIYSYDIESNVHVIKYKCNRKVEFQFSFSCSSISIGITVNKEDSLTPYHSFTLSNSKNFDEILLETIRSHNEKYNILTYFNDTHDVFVNFEDVYLMSQIIEY